MTRRNWKALRPTSLRQALECCKDHAKDRLNRSVERIAEEMGLADHWAIYKWIETGRIPAVLIRPFETACGIDYVTRWLAASESRLLIDLPKGHTATPVEMGELQATAHEAVGQLFKFYAGTASADEALAAVQQALEGFAWHRRNIEKHPQPELDLTHVPNT